MVCTLGQIITCYYLLFYIWWCLCARNSDNVTIWRLSFVLRKGQMTIYG